VVRMDNARTLASFHRRDPSAVTASPQSAARTPGTLLAAMETPVPVQHHTIPNSHSPLATDRPTRWPTVTQGVAAALDSPTAGTHSIA
jgi:hypothetical protein